MDLGELRGMPRLTGGKVPLTHPTAREVGASPAREAPRASSKRPAPPPPEQAEDAGRHQKKIKGGKVEELLRREASEKELQAVRGHLGDAQQLLKEARTRARRMDDELLQAVKDLKSTRAELPGQAVARYKGCLDFKEGLKRMGRVTYEYEYRVALARFRD
ncbi:hypothetical protein BHM03_00049099 [Ensete ventricosum]|nr:hypothetical protein BHM03_00049099 [Ensete ventricosum]